MKRLASVMTSILILAALVGQLGQGQTRPKPEPTTGSLAPVAVKALDDLGDAIIKIDNTQRILMQSVSKLQDLYAKLSAKVTDAGKLVGPAGKNLPYLRAQAGGNELVALVRAVKELSEMNQSFNMQYLQLQQQMQDENRRFSLLSNIMKEKHDTAKNSISNLR